MARVPLLHTLKRCMTSATLCGLFATLLSASNLQAASPLEIHPGDHISLVGNTLADRMQHDGWLEAFLNSRFPTHQLVIRNLGFSGDEVTLRLRSDGFGSPDHWLEFNKSDVVFAFFGYNESYRGAEGLESFKRELSDFVKHTLAQKYNGTSAPRLVLFSPIAHEDLHDRNLPDGSENNRRLEAYTAAIGEIAEAGNVGFVDLFHPTKAAYQKAKAPLTINGIHATPEGNRTIAEIIDTALFATATARDPRALEKLRQAILEKNFYWYNLYRTVDGYSIFGGRADLRFVGGQTNRVVAQREMEVLDVMTANRDKRIWSVANGGDLQVDDSNTPPFIPVTTNKPGAGPKGEHLFLSGEDAIKSMTVAKGFRVNLFASEKEFPLLAKPVQMSFDNKGRLWVAVWPTYPHWKPKEEMNDKLLILEDTDGDGKADKLTTFADHLHCPTGFEFANGGVLIAQAPDLVFLKDTDGDDKADVRRSVISGLDTADTHHASNSFTLDPGGALYFQEGTFHHTQVETPYGPSTRCVNAGVFRYEPKAQKFDVYVSYGFANPHGHAFDHWGQDTIIDGTGANPYHGTLFSGHLDYPNKHNRPPQVYQQRTRPCPGVEVLSSRHFPSQYQNTLLVPNVIGAQGILMYKIEDNDASFAGSEMEPLLMSSDANFRPSDVEVGPDGAIYFLDWQNPIIGHMQHNLRDPSRDRIHGRVYRVTYEGRPLLQPAKIAGEPIPKLLDLLKSPEDRERYRAKVELSGRDADEVVAALGKWLNSLDKSDPESEHHQLEGLWVYQYQNVVNIEVLKRVLKSPDFRARAAATRVLCYWRDRVPDALALLKGLAADPYPRVRLEAIRAASFFNVAEAVEIPLISAEHPSDDFLEFIRGETMRALDPYWRKDVAEGKPIPFTSVAGVRFLMAKMSNDELLKMKRDRAVDHEILFRPGIRDEVRREILADLARLDKKSELQVLIDGIRSQDALKGEQDETVVIDLARLLTGRGPDELSKVRDELQSLAMESNLPITRQLGFVAFIAAEGKVDRVWKLAETSVRSLLDLVNAMPLIRDAGQRAELYPKVVPLLKGLPASLEKGASREIGGSARYVRIELKGPRTLTLAEVEVLSDGRNVARSGKASQKNTDYDGDAKRAIDGNKSGEYGAGGQTHTQEQTSNPWWEVDLGTEYPIDSIAIYNRTEADFAKRLDGFSLKALDSARNVVFEKVRQPAPSKHVVVNLGGGSPASLLRRAAMNALTYVRGREAVTFKALAHFVHANEDRTAAIQALQRIPAAEYPTEEVRPLLDDLVGYVKSIPTTGRTAPAALNALQLADSLVTALPRDQSKELRRVLSELGVRVLRLGTLPEQMLYDKERLVVQAGKAVEIVFENNDLMPHNFVVTRPGGLEEVGMLAESTATDPGSLQRQYVPQTDKVIFASRLLQPRETQKLSLTAPGHVGVYPYVCTYPGHWRRMYGSLYVVEDLDEYLADPEGYLAAHPVSIHDVLLRSNRPRKEWKLEDLTAFIQPIPNGRSFSNGKQLFEVANCMSCHKLNGVGQEIGPDLTKLDSKLKPVDILTSILDPSAKVEDKYATYNFETEGGKVITGLILENNDREFKVIENPLAKSDPIIIKRSDVLERVKSASSIMPKGLLDKLTREEVLDLLAYVISRGDAKNPVFQADSGHEHGH